VKKFDVFLVTSGGVGLLPAAPGTWGSLVGLGLAALAGDWQSVILLAGLATVLGLALARPAQEHFGVKDPQAFVLDETAGQLVALCFLPLTAATFAAGFVLFRFFDILKPIGIRKIDRMGHPSTIVLDDLAAGLAANLILQALVRFFPSVFIG
jgi:phosphatidylglycerophosphatase A